MRLVPVGVGQAGGRVVDALLEYESRAGADLVVDAVAINTARQDLRGLEHVPGPNRHLVGEARVAGGGVGADNELAAAIADEERAELVGTLDGVPASRTDAFLVVAALGGGTGSGIAPVLARELRRVHDLPVYGLGVLPGPDEGGVYALNAARSLRTLRREADALLLADNGVWKTSGESVGDAHDEINRELARRLGVLFGAGEVDGAVAESVVDASEIVNTLAVGGVAGVGYAASAIGDGSDGGDGGGRLGGLLGGEADVDETTAVNLVTATVRKATQVRPSLPYEHASVARALVVVSGPPAWLSRKGVERSRRWVEAELDCMAVRGGDDPVPGSDRVAATVLYAGVTESRRLDELEAVAAEAETERREREERLGDDVESLRTDDRLDSLF